MTTISLSGRCPIALTVLLAILAVSACDSDSDPDPDPVVFQGVEVDARGDASLAVQSGALVVSGLDGSRSGGFAVAGQPSRLDVEIDGLDLPSGTRFGIVVEAEDGAEIASLFNEGRGEGEVDFQFTFADGLGIEVAVVRYLLGGEAGETVFEGEIDLGQLRQGRRRATSSAGSGEGSTGSTHVIRENGRYIVVSDSEGSGARHAGCSGFFVTPPPPFEPGRSYCTDWIEIEPVLLQTMPQGTISVVARGVGSFTVRDLRAR